MKAIVTGIPISGSTVREFTIEEQDWIDDEYAREIDLLNEDSVVIVTPKDSRQNVINYGNMSISCAHSTNTLTFTKNTDSMVHDVDVVVIIM